jgi:tetratricopeptide (TPR) repeat protein
VVCGILIWMCPASPQAAGGPAAPLVEIEQALQSNQFGRALDLSQTALSKTPGDYRLWTLRGMAYAGASKPSLALAAYRHALKLAPDFLPALEGAAQAEYVQGAAVAKADLLHILRLDPNNQTAHSMLAMIAFAGHDCAQAVEHFQQAAQAIDGQTQALSAYGSCLTEMGRYDEAVPVLARLADLVPGTNSRYNLALAQWKAGHVEDAGRSLQPVLDAGVADTDTLMLAADIEEAKGNTSAAIELLRTAILSSPQNPDPYLQFAMLSSSHNSFQVGIDMVNAGLKQLPGSAQLYLARGILFAQMGNVTSAMDDFEAAGRLDPSLSFLGAAKGVAATQGNNYDAALAHFREEVKRHPDDPLSQALLAETLASAGKPEGSPEFREEMGAATRALELDPKLVAARDILAGLYLAAGKNDEAIEQSEAALKIDPKDQQAVYHLILALRKTDRKGEIPGLTKRLMELRSADKAAASKVRQLVEIPSGKPSAPAPPR